MPGVDGIAATNEIVSMQKPARVLVMTTFNPHAQVLVAFCAGTSGYLLKTNPTDQIVQIIRVVAAGGPALSPEWLQRLIASSLQLQQPVTPQLEP